MTEWSTLPKNVMDFLYVPKKDHKKFRSFNSIDNDLGDKKVIRAQIFDFEIGDLHKIGSEEEVVEPEKSYVPRDEGVIRMYSSILDSVGSQSSCSLPKDPGNCNNKTERWFYDESTRKCEPLIFNGCGGNH